MRKSENYEDGVHVGDHYLHSFQYKITSTENVIYYETKLGLPDTSGYVSSWNPREEIELNESFLTVEDGPSKQYSYSDSGTEYDPIYESYGDWWIVVESISERPPFQLAEITYKEFDLLQYSEGGTTLKWMQLSGEQTKAYKAIDGNDIRFDEAPYVYGTSEVRLLKVDVAVDADRSGTEFNPGIEFGGADQTSEDEPYVFWINNDVDHGNDDEAEDREPNVAPDYLDGQIDFSRDLEDFSRIWINVDGIADQLKDGSLRLGLEWKNVSEGDPAIKLYDAVEVDGGMKYLFDENVANLQKSTAPPSPYAAIAMENNAGNPAQTVNDRVFFPEEFWDDLPGTGIVHFLFEATSAGKGELVFSLQANTAGLPQDIDMSMSGVWFDLKDIEQIYQHFTVGDDINAVPASSASPVSGSPSKTDLDEMNFEDDYILFVHGWRMKKWERRYFAETAFKRLYWLGYKGRFGMFSWPTEWTTRPIGTAITDTENYMRSDQKAMQSGQGLAGVMNTLMGDYNGQLKIFAHSMGNVVVSEALRQGGQANTYVACQSASVARAYDSMGPERLTSQRINNALSGKSYGAGDLAAWMAAVDSHPDVFANYPPTSEVYFKDISSNVFSGIINHHNRDDDALAWWLAGQAKKPNSNYAYNVDGVDWNRLMPPVNGAPPYWQEMTFANDTFEILTRAAEPDSVPLGASVTTGHSTAGEITGNVNLNTLYDFQDGEEDHSAQFRSTIQRRSDYWKQLYDDFFLTAP